MMQQSEAQINNVFVFFQVHHFDGMYEDKQVYD